MRRIFRILARLNSLTGRHLPLPPSFSNGKADAGEIMAHLRERRHAAFWKAFFDGFGLTMMLQPSPVHRQKLPRHDTLPGWQRDRAAIADDWDKIGGDMRRAMDKYRASRGLRPLRRRR